VNINSNYNHSEIYLSSQYSFKGDICLNNSIAMDKDDLNLRNADKLIISPTESDNLDFVKNGRIVLIVPIGNIEKVTTISDIRKKNKESCLEITFRDTELQKERSVTFEVINKKHVDIIQQQIQLLRDVVWNPSIQKAVKSALNPELCNTCAENEYTFEFNSVGKLCVSCFENEYGKILQETDDASAQYHGGHKDHILKGIVGKYNKSGQMYLTENYFIFAKDDKEVSKKWEIIVPLSSVVMNWDLEETQRKKYAEWEATKLNSFGFGSGFVYHDGNLTYLVVPHMDKNGLIQKPEFRLQSSIKKWAPELYKMVVKAKENLAEDQKKENMLEDTMQTSATCFNCDKEAKIYDLIICKHCITSFCQICINHHDIEPELAFDSKYMGGHKLYPKPMDSKVYIFSDRIEIESISVRIRYGSIKNIENSDERKFTAKHFLLVGVFAFAWKKRYLYTIIEYVDGFNQQQVLILDFRNNIELAQQKIYDKMMASHLASENMKKSTTDVTMQKITDDSVVTPLTIQKAREDDNNSPLHILKVRLAKGEISKEEYEELRKMLES
jgi:Short C-terminal domain